MLKSLVSLLIKYHGTEVVLLALLEAVQELGGSPVLTAHIERAVRCKTQIGGGK